MVISGVASVTKTPNGTRAWFLSCSYAHTFSSSLDGFETRFSHLLCLHVLSVRDKLSPRKKHNSQNHQKEPTVALDFPVGYTPERELGEGSMGRVWLLGLMGLVDIVP